jgi:hypothetical protein
MHIGDGLTDCSADSDAYDLTDLDSDTSSDSCSNPCAYYDADSDTDGIPHCSAIRIPY